MSQSPFALSIAKGLMRNQSNPLIILSSAKDARSGRTGTARAQAAKHTDVALNRTFWLTVLAVIGTMTATVSPFAEAQLLVERVVDDGIPLALTAQPGDATRGRDIVTNRQIGMCQLCHQVPMSTDRFQGDIATSLSGAGARWTVPQLRLRIVDSRRVNAESVMPAYYKVQSLTRVGATWRDTPILNGQQVEDVVAWLASLK